MRFAKAAFFAVMFVGLNASADIFILQDGNTIEGDVISETDSEITIQGRFGKTKLKRADIREIQKKQSPHAMFVERLDELQKSDKKDDKDSWLDLGRFAKSAGQREDTHKAYAQVLKLDANNEEAHLALGHVRQLGSWITAEEKRKLEGGGNAAAANNDDKNAGGGGPSQVASLGIVDTKSGSSKRVDCSACGATGYSGWFDCKQCKRSGKPGWLNMGEHMEMCGTCHGKGKLPGVPCKQCGGTGKVDPEKPATPMGRPIPPGFDLCSGCGGTGYETWNPCNQCKRSPQPGYLDMNGYIQICTRCSGYGKMPGVPCSKCNTTGLVKKP
ncbi:MAG: hypothetical protein HY291_20065 [Planctomycetes bacterium]|nr:hypothetical protein [Planctomycetota bacterium]